ncbi:ATP-binding cassette, subfamily B [Sediminibacterium ginsengisoli]|uniref:ATP-binding cassette, subfamily B n=2 Tax=Sediminibacterium ginsengisoli TaxID=413434 RepID=A0A1T4QD40_9BACT|nr:ATP-binding cassette, subfamily B [Sediminibacterium ginsengisoli]
MQVALALLPVLSLYTLKLLIEAVTGHTEIIPVIIAFGIIQFLQALATQYAVYIGTLQQQLLTDHLSAQVLEKATGVAYSYYENPAYHDRLHLAQQQSLFKAAALPASLNSILTNSLSVLFLAGFLFTLEPLFAALFVLLSLPLAVVKWYSGHALVKTDHRLAKQEREAGYYHQVLSGVSFAKEVRLFGFAADFTGRFRRIRAYITAERKKQHSRWMLYSLIAETLEIVVMVSIFASLTKNAWEGTITIGVLVIYIQGFQRLQTTSRNFLQAVVQLFQQRVFLGDLFSFFNMPSVSRPGTKDQDLNGGLHISDLSFTYPGGSHPVLKDISIDCEPGQIIAIVGENGSGKSTLVKLMARLYELQSGRIQLGSNRLEDISEEIFRSKSAFVFQDFEKYFLSINDNIAFQTDVTAAQQQAIEAAAEMSGAASFIRTLPAGYHTKLGHIFHGGVQLSGGQWQKIAIARLFYKNADLIVLDEPTSALDAAAEFAIFDNIRKHKAGKIIVLITHRLYNLKIADHIYFLQNGRIAEEGSFSELVQSNGFFREMYDKQQL